MRNMSMKTPFVKPNPSNSFRKSNREYDHPINLDQPVQLLPEKFRKHFCGKKPMKQFDVEHERYQFQVMNPFVIKERNSVDSYTDNVTLWFRNLDSVNRKKYLTINETNYTISQWTNDQFPSKIYICMENLSGYLDAQGLPTDRIACLQITQMQTIIDQSNLRAYDLRYEIKKPITWEIPPQQTYIKLYLKVDSNQEPIVLPLPSPLSLGLEISYK